MLRTRQRHAAACASATAADRAGSLSLYHCSVLVQGTGVPQRCSPVPTGTSCSRCHTRARPGSLGSPQRVRPCCCLPSSSCTLLRCHWTVVKGLPRCLSRQAPGASKTPTCVPGGAAAGGLVRAHAHVLVRASPTCRRSQVQCHTWPAPMNSKHQVWGRHDVLLLRSLPAFLTHTGLATVQSTQASFSGGMRRASASLHAACKVLLKC